METFYREQLQNERRAITIMEEHIKFLERFVQDESSKWRINRCRDILKGWKKYERELVRWQEERQRNPGLHTDMAAIARLERISNEIYPPAEWTIAPPPREKK